MATKEGHAAPTEGADGTTAAEFWDTRYGTSDRIWSGNPNAALVREAAELAPGAALDLGCGEGADTVWLAQQGWRVTATDISQVALGRAVEHARAAGVGDRIDWQQHDLGDSFPAGAFDLVSVPFLHAPFGLPRERILRTAAEAVAPGGVLLVVGHAGPPSWEQDAPHRIHFPTPEEDLAALDLPAERWELLRREVYDHPMPGPDGKPASRPDYVLKLRRSAA